MHTITIDCETTGIPGKGLTYDKDFLQFPRIVSLGFKINGEDAVEYIVNQEGQKIPEESIKIHGITDAMADASLFKIQDVLQLLLDQGKPDTVLGFNLYFDTSIIKASVLRLIHEEKWNMAKYIEIEDFCHKDRRIDVMRRASKFIGGSPYVKLSVVSEKLFGVPYVGHSAKADCEETHKCFMELLLKGF